jgi:hypothetical protein
MAVSKQQLEQILGKARDLCNPEGDRLIESYKSQNSNDPDPSDYDDYSEFDRMYLNEEESHPQQKRKPQAKDIRYNQATAANSRMPENIKQSMLNEVIDANPLGDLNIPQRKPQKRQQIREEQQYQQPMQGGGIDYSIIKAIVNECLNEYFSRQPLNESNTLTTIGLKSGTIKLVDNKGNVYSADLKKLGNTNNN